MNFSELYKEIQMQNILLEYHLHFLNHYCVISVIETRELVFPLYIPNIAPDVAILKWVVDFIILWFFIPPDTFAEIKNKISPPPIISTKYALFVFTGKLKFSDPTL